MEYTAAAYPQMHQDQNANPNPPQQQPQPQPQPHPISTSLYSSYYYPPANAVAADPQNQHITAQFYNTDPTTSLTPPGVASYTNYPHLAYCFDPNSNTWVAKEAVQQYGSALAAFPAPVKITLVEAQEIRSNNLLVGGLPFLYTTLSSNHFANLLALTQQAGLLSTLKLPLVADAATLPVILILQRVMFKSNTIPPNGTEQLAVSHLDSTLWANLTFLAQGNSNQKKQQKKTQQKKMKVVQSAYCEVCKVDCNSKDVLDQHKLGKKHKKNLEKLQAAAAGCSVSAGSSNPVIGPQENPSKSENGNGQKSKKKAAEPLEDLDTKRRRILEGGAAADAVRVCSFCNVVCNSDTVFNSHLAGQKHAAMLKKLAGIRMATAI
ncbi:hypothetical protein Peur_064099 [Populus x canadensis]